MACSKEALRILLWMSWATQWLLSSIFVGLTLTSFSRLSEASSLYLSNTNLFTDKSWRAPMSACLLSSLLVLGFDIMSCVTLIKKSINRAGPGFGYGFIVAFCFCLSFFLLLSGLVLDSFRPKINSLASYDWTQNGTLSNGFTWSTYDSQTFIGAEVFALINFVTLLFFAVTLVVLQTGVSEQLGINKTQYTPLDAAPVMLPPGYPGGGAGFAAPETQYGYDAHYGYDETQTLRAADNQALNVEYDQYGSSTQQGDAGYYQNYGAAAAAAPAAITGGTAYYGHAAYGGAAVYSQPTSNYNYQSAAEDPSSQPAVGSGLLGGQAIGTSPAAAASNPPPPYHAYQQQVI
ncbi:hypothetical protein CEUSTIGMA_g7609.t1 [Chlamydomonas eustigma]|uniref:Uncharacterized protein n=1 Tax=Chlamydomonas eustigma TaxID=1157962 RepID=A0A250XAQ3_9CHLO|nr:hypothetical protein CEUSTIGMA_g7609.t1 [Chlamydomonas eustigma]|eukprot:GAX80171.1 hypothetical protein CEUSTIGMA_g7609.t1 [Chlamydomonas eustigma]